jgi:hypothetical protein
LVPDDSELPGADNERHRLVRWVSIGTVVLAFFLSVSSAIWLRSPIGHDEAVYSLRARDLLNHGWSTTTGSYWTDYRAPGLSVLMSLVGQVIGLHVSTSRAIVMVLGAAIVVATWDIARRIGGDIAGVVAALVLTASFGFTLTSSVLLADVPGAAFAIVAVVVYFAEIERGVLRWSFVLVPVLTFCGTVSRFGAPFMLAAGLVGVSLIAVVDVYRARNWVLVGQALLLAAAVALTCALVLLTDLLSLGTLSPVEANRRLIDGKGYDTSSGLRDLERVVNPWSGYVHQLWSRPVAIFAAAGIGLAIIGVLLKKLRARVVIGVGFACVSSTMAIVVSVGLVQTNYLVLTLPYWAILAGLGYGWFFAEVWRSAARAEDWRPALIVAGVLVAIPFVADAAHDARSKHVGYEISFGVIRGASVAAGDGLGDDCLLVTSYSPQVGYYSRCRVVTFDKSRLDSPLLETLPRRIDAALRGRSDVGAIGVFIVENGKRQPAADEFETSPALERARLFEIGEDGHPKRHAWVQIIRPCVADMTC